MHSPSNLTGPKRRSVQSMRLLCVAVLVAFALVFVSASSSAPTRSQTNTFAGVVIASFPTSLNALPFTYPDAFKKYGLHLGVYSSGGGSETLRVLLAGSQNIHFATSAPSAVVSAVQAGAPIEIIAGDADTGFDYNWVAKAGSKLNSIKDLQGKTVAITGPGSGTQILLNICLAENGVTGVKEVATGGTGPGLVALQNGGVDVAPILQPQLAADTTPYKVLFTGRDCVKRYQTAVIVTTKDYANQHPAIVRDFLKAMKWSFAEIAKDPTAAGNHWAKALNLPPKPSYGAFMKKVAAARGLNLEIDVPGINSTVGAYGSIGIKGPIDWTSFIDQRFLPKGIAHADISKLAQP